MLHSKVPLGLVSLLLLLSIVACTSTSIYNRGALFEMVLRPYPAYPNLLVNQRCVKYERSVCVETDTLLFDLKVEEDKKQLRELKFICKVGTGRFGVCPDGAGLCQYTRVKSCLLCSKKQVLVKMLDIEKDFKFILNSNTYCAAQDSFIGKRMFNQ